MVTYVMTTFARRLHMTSDKPMISAIKKFKPTKGLRIFHGLRVSFMPGPARNLHANNLQYILKQPTLLLICWILIATIFISNKFCMETPSSLHHFYRIIRWHQKRHLWRRSFAPTRYRAPAEVNHQLRPINQDHINADHKVTDHLNRWSFKWSLEHTTVAKMIQLMVNNGSSCSAMVQNGSLWSIDCY